MLDGNNSKKGDVMRVFLLATMFVCSINIFADFPAGKYTFKQKTHAEGIYWIVWDVRFQAGGTSYEIVSGWPKDIRSLTRNLCLLFGFKNVESFDSHTLPTQGGECDSKCIERAGNWMVANADMEVVETKNDSQFAYGKSGGYSTIENLVCKESE